VKLGSRTPPPSNVWQESVIALDANPDGYINSHLLMLGLSPVVLAIVESLFQQIAHKCLGLIAIQDKFVIFSTGYKSFNLTGTLYVMPWIEH
jgi:hypothetical protein